MHIGTNLPEIGAYQQVVWRNEYVGKRDIPCPIQC